MFFESEIWKKISLGSMEIVPCFHEELLSCLEKGYYLLVSFHDTFNKVYKKGHEFSMQIFGRS